MADARERLEKLRRLKELRSRVARKPEPPPDPTEGMSRWEKLGAGYVSGLNTGIRGATNLAHVLQTNLGPQAIADKLVGIERPQEPFFSDETLSEIHKRDKPLRSGGAGMVGGITGEVAATAPLGTFTKALQAVRGSSQALPWALRTLTARPTAAAAEGALSGAMTSAPEDRERAADMGALFGLAGERFGAGLGRTMRGLVRRSAQAKELEHLADLHGAEVDLPLSVAADDKGIISPLMRFIYRKVLPSVPGAEGPLTKQADNAATQVRELALKEAAPTGLGSTQTGFASALPLTTRGAQGAGTRMHTTIAQIQQAFDKEYADTVKSYVFNAPDEKPFMAKLLQEFPNIDDTTMGNVALTAKDLIDRYAKNGVLDGDNLIRVRTALARAGREAGDERTGQAFFKAQEVLDDLVHTELSAGGKTQNLRDLQRYESLSEPWKNFQRVQRATARTKDPTGAFSPDDLMSAVKGLSDDPLLARGAAPMQKLASVGQQTAGQALENPSYLERAAVLSGLGALGFFSGGPTGVGLLWGGARGMASPATQRALMGQTSAQRAVQEFLRRNPNSTMMLGAGLRNSLAANAAEEMNDASQ